MADFGEPLSERELDVLRVVVDGAANKEIARILTISQNTVKVHLRNIYTKLGVSSRTEAVTAAMQQGLVTLPGMEPAATIEAPPEEPVESVVGDTAAVELDTAVPPSPESPSRFSLNRTEIALILVTLVVVVLVGFFGWQSLSAPDEVTPEPFVEEPIGETRWLRNRPMPEGKASMAVVAVGLEVYAIGGETAVGITDAVSAYNTIDHVWMEKAAKPTAVSEVSAAVLFGEIYVPGGRLADGSVTAVVEAYSPANNAWRPVAALPQPVAGGLTLSDGSFLYLFGGWNGEQYLDTSYVYDPGSDSWRPLDPMPQPRAFATGEFVTRQLYVVGGTDGSELAVCEAYDPIDASWSDCPDMLVPRAGAGAAALLNKLYIFGGGLAGAEAISYSEAYDPATQTWQVVNMPTLAENWTNLGVANVETRIYALGGQRGNQFLADTLVYSPFVYQTFIPAAASGQ
jgi:DNA-binding CsgD family transcriptional regulator/N-acetylneuraminic acid mutarotase